MTGYQRESYSADAVMCAEAQTLIQLRRGPSINEVRADAGPKEIALICACKSGGRGSSEKLSKRHLSRQPNSAFSINLGGHLDGRNDKGENSIFKLNSQILDFY